MHRMSRGNSPFARIIVAYSHKCCSLSLALNTHEFCSSFCPSHLVKLFFQRIRFVFTELKMTGVDTVDNYNKLDEILLAFFNPVFSPSTTSIKSLYNHPSSVKGILYIKFHEIHQCVVGVLVLLLF